MTALQIPRSRPGASQPLAPLRPLLRPALPSGTSAKPGARPTLAIPRSPPAPARVPLVQIEPMGDITVVTFTRRSILTGETVEAIAQQLYQLAEQEGRRKLVLNFGNVDRLASAMLGKLLLLNRKLRGLGGKLVLCRIAPHLYEIFALLRLSQVFGIFAEEQEALQALCRRPDRRGRRRTRA